MQLPIKHFVSEVYVASRFELAKSICQRYKSNIFSFIVTMKKCKSGRRKGHYYVKCYSSKLKDRRYSPTAGVEIRKIYGVRNSRNFDPIRSDYC